MRVCMSACVYARVCAYVYVQHMHVCMPECKCGGQRTILKSWFFSFYTWVMRLSGLVAGVFPDEPS